MPDALERARRALAAAPAGLLSDLDGTLAPIVDDPAAVRLVDGAVDALERLARSLAVVGIVTGRAAADARRILGTDRLLVVGNHGLEWHEPGSEQATPPPGADALRAAVERGVDAVPAEGGVEVEDKGLSATVHVRRAPDPAGALARIRAALDGGAAAGLELRPGRMSIELRPLGAGDKGTAVRTIVARYRLRGLVVLGDDVTDLDMFRAVASLRAEGGLEAAILAIRGGREVPAEIERAADAVLGSPSEVVALLQGLAA